MNLNARKHNVPNLRFASFTKDWINTNLGRISNGVDYGLASAAVNFDGENKYLRITDIDEQSNRFSPSPLCSPQDKVDPKYVLRKGDIVFARTGASVGKSYLFDQRDGRLIFAGYLIRFSINQSQANPKFVFLLTQRSDYRNWVSIVSKRSGQPGINAEEYRTLQFFIPNLEEQQKIASFLYAVDIRIEQLEKKRSLFEQYKKGLMQKLFRQELRFKDDQGNEYPDWEERKLGVVFSERKETGFSEYELLSVTISDGVIRACDLDRRDTSPLDKSRYKKVVIDDIPYNSMRMWQGASGVSNFDGIVSPAYTVIVPTNGQVSDFWSYFFKLRNVLHLFQRYSQGLTSDTWNLKFPEFSQIKLPVPTTEEQRKIADFLSSVDRKIELILEQISQTREFKKGLLQQMFV